MRARRSFCRILAAASLAATLASCAAAAPPIQLIETRPIETKLGNPDLPAALDTWLELINGSRRTLDIEQFYLSTWPGEPMEQVIAALGKAAKRGVRVRLVLDRRMYATYPRVADSLAKVPGFQVRLVDFGRIAGGVQHAKYFLVDGEAVFLGSQNFDWRALKHIHELGVLARDARIAAEFQQVFDLDWDAATPAGAAPDTTRSFAAAQHPHAAGSLPYRVVQAKGDTALVTPSWSPKRFIPDTTLWDRDVIVRALDAARHEIVLQLLTYSPAGRGERDEALDAALRRAAARGVSVKLVISDWVTGSRALDDLKSLSKVPNVEIRLSTLPEWSGGYIPFARVEHCKYAVVDSAVTWIGTSNWEPSYFSATRNIALTIENRRLAGRARRVFETSWTAPSAARLDPERTYTAKERGETPPAGKKKYGG